MDAQQWAGKRKAAWPPLWLVVLVLIFAPAVQAQKSAVGQLSTPFAVNSTLDAADASPGDGLCATAAGSCSLRAAIEESNAVSGEDTVILAAGVYTLTLGHLEISDDLTLTGQGPEATAVQGNGLVTNDRVVTILSPAVVTMADLTISGGGGTYSLYKGGGIYNTGATLTLTNTVLSGNYARWDGGGLYNDQGTVTITNSTLQGNVATLYSGGGFYNYLGTVVAQGSTFTGNNGGSQGGGGFNSGGTVTISQSTLTGNVSRTGSGVGSAGGVLTIDGSAISGNTAVFSGGGLYSGGELILTRSTVTDNVTWYGGGIHYNGLSGGRFTIRDSAIVNNQAINYGGGLYLLNGSGVLINSTIAGNVATVYGGAIYSTAALSVYHSTLSGNTAEFGGGIYWLNNTITLQGTILAANAATWSYPDCSGTITSNGYNLVGDNSGCAFNAATGDLVGTAAAPLDPLLGPLQDNGGATWSLAPLPGSPAVDASDPAACLDDQGNNLATDQRGYVRPVDGTADSLALCDLGAVEYGSAAQIEFDLAVSPSVLATCAPATAQYSVTLSVPGGFGMPVTLEAGGQPEGTTIAFTANPATPPGVSELAVGNMEAATAGQYGLTITGTAASLTRTATVSLHLDTAAPLPLLLLAPADDAPNQSLRPTFTWAAAGPNNTYSIEVAADSGFANVVAASSGLTQTTYSLAADLSLNTVYYWRVRASNACGEGDFSAVYRFISAAAAGQCSFGSTPVTLFSEDFETGAAGWRHGGPGDSWAITSERTYSGSYAYQAVDEPFVTDQQLESAPAVLPADAGPLTLQFWQYHDIEHRLAGGCWDGAVLEVSADGGASWSQLNEELLTNAYDGAIQAGSYNPLVGYEAWCGLSQGWEQTVVDLDAYAGQRVQFRFRLATDNGFGREGWTIDDVQAQSCRPNVMIVRRIQLVYEFSQPDQLSARVRVADPDSRRPVAGVTVSVTFTLPAGTVSQSAVTDSQGWASFAVETAGGGTCTLQVESADLLGYSFDGGRSILGRSVEC
ncbi:MAG: choice-of-anchor Q domain-containing protein [Chloroflexota bacterium]